MSYLLTSDDKGGYPVELRHLRYFVAVAEYGSFTHAAARLHVSQPTMSQQIRELERELGVELLHRGPEGTHLSAIGEVFYQRALAIQQAISDAAAEVRRMATAETLLRVGVLYPLPYELHLIVLSAFRTAFPNVRISLHELSLPDYVTPLLDGDLDVALLYPPLDPDLLTWEELTSESRGVAVPAGHLFWDSDTVDIVDFLEESIPHIAVQVPQPILRFWTLMEHRNGERPRLAGEPVGTITELVLAVGLHGVLCPAPWAYRHASPGPRIRILPIAGAPGAPVAAARRVNDRRPLPAAFCSLAARTVHTMRYEPSPQPRA